MIEQMDDTTLVLPFLNALVVLNLDSFILNLVRELDENCLLYQLITRYVTSSDVFFLPAFIMSVWMDPFIYQSKKN